MTIDEIRVMLDRAGVPRRFQRYQAPVHCQSERRVAVATGLRFWPERVRLLASLVCDGLATAHRETMEALGGTSKADRTRSAASCQSAGTPHSRSG